MYQHNLYNETPEKLEVLPKGKCFIVAENTDGDYFDYMYMVTDPEFVTEEFILAGVRESHIDSELVDVLPNRDVVEFRGDLFVTVFELPCHPLLFDIDSEIYEYWTKLENKRPEGSSYIPEELQEETYDILAEASDWGFDTYEFNFVYDSE